MVLLLIFAFVSGCLTILAPCIWPLLPVVLSSTATGGRRKPLGITLGVMASFAFFTLTLSYLVHLLHIDANLVRLMAAVVIGVLGVSLIFPGAASRLEAAASRVLGGFGGQPEGGDGFRPGLITGLSLGIVWTPCAGPILATIAALAATREVNLDVVLVTVVYIIGVGVPLYLFSTFGSRLLTRSRVVSRYTGTLQRVFGVVMVLTAVAIYTNYDTRLGANLLNAVPSYSNLLTKFETGGLVSRRLDALKGVESEPRTAQAGSKGGSSGLPNYGKAPDFSGITNFLNLPDGTTSLSLGDLRGKVVLIDFWTYTCINCVRTLPDLRTWYASYKDQGLVVVGVHTPEFQFEYSTSNVARAIKQYDIEYPVAQDNNYGTWKAFSNQYWPAEYLLDVNGNIRYVHFGEGRYDETENAIKALLIEAGQTPVQAEGVPPDLTPTGNLTPETYLGSARMARFTSNEKVTGKTQVFTPVRSLVTDHFSYDGTWTVGAENAVSGDGAGLNIDFLANHVYLVMTPGSQPELVRVLLDGKPIPPEDAGADVMNGQITVDNDRLYDIVYLPGKPSNHVLRLEFPNGGTAVYAFTFG